jgi:hypothetical protein
LTDLDKRIARLSIEKRALLERALASGFAADTDSFAIPRVAGLGPRPLSFAQERMWFLSQMSPDSPVYNIPRAFRIDGALDMQALERALHAIVSRHEVFRTSIAVADETPMQTIAETWSLPMPITDLGRLPEERREAEVERLLVEEARRPFDLSLDLMMRASVLRLDHDTHVLSLVMHHIAFDGWSDQVLVQELASLYQSQSTGVPSDLPARSIQYADYAAWQRQKLDEEGL